MRRPLLLLLAATPLFGSSAPGLRPVLGMDARMHADPVALDHLDPARSRAGLLTYLGGVQLTSSDPAFGGFSAMQVAGDRFTLLSDGGNVVRFRMGADWQPRDIAFGDLPGPGSGAQKYQRDSESLTSDPATGRNWVGFENANAIWRYDAALRRAEKTAEPPAMARWEGNAGPESLVRLASGQFVALAETRAQDGEGVEALLFADDPAEAPRRALRFRYVPPKGYDPSDAAELPDGRLLVLNRRLSLAQLFTAKLTILDLAGIRANKAVRGREIATLAAPLLHDNFEALAVTREGTDTIVWIASDDNQQFWERSLLLKFRLNDEHAKSPPSAWRTGLR